LNFDRDVAPDPRSTVTESAFAKLGYASGNGEKMLAGGVLGKSGTEDMWMKKINVVVGGKIVHCR
jgi:hypothetical protein